MRDKWIVLGISVFSSLAFFFTYSNSIKTRFDYAIFLGGMFCFLVIPSIVYLIFNLKKEVEG